MQCSPALDVHWGCKKSLFCCYSACLIKTDLRTDGRSDLIKPSHGNICMYMYLGRKWIGSKVTIMIIWQKQPTLVFRINILTLLVHGLGHTKWENVHVRSYVLHSFIYWKNATLTEIFHYPINHTRLYVYKKNAIYDISHLLLQRKPASCYRSMCKCKNNLVTLLCYHCIL